MSPPLSFRQAMVLSRKAHERRIGKNTTDEFIPEYWSSGGEDESDAESTGKAASPRNPASTRKGKAASGKGRGKTTKATATGKGRGRMVYFKLIYLRRSDGEMTVFGPRGEEANRPTDEQLDPTPDKDGKCDYYREVAIDDMKSVLWRRKLGYLLAHYIGLDQNLNYILADFPENYRLYEHIKVGGKKNEGDAPKAKNHAGGGLDRQDAYLYGHPLGRKKRFRSPNDFYWHLDWLAANTTEELNPDDCSCKVCCPEEIKDKTASLEAYTEFQQNQRKEKKERTAAAIAKAVADGQDPQQFSPAARLAALGPSNKAKAAERTMNAAARVHARTHVASPAKSVDHELDSSYGVFMYRQGELVWFHRGVAWGLGVVVSRFKNGATSHYKVQPLSWPGHSTPVADLSDDHNLRPWLAWSVPPYTHAWLNNNTTAVLNYNTFDFPGLAQGRYGPGSIEVDASILAAKAIDATYTTFAQESRTEPEPGVIEVRWGGVYLGAEKVWLNDPVRMHDDNTGGEARVLVVRSIVERTTKSAFNNQTWAALTFVGDIFRIAKADVPRQYSDGSNHKEFPAGAPPRMAEDLCNRNKVIIENSGTALFWNPIDANVTFQLKDIKGRWYESTLLGPILLPKEEHEKKSYGTRYEDIVLTMNSRGDCNTLDSQRLLPDVRTTTRVQAFGRAVPQNTVIVEDDRPPQKPAQPAANFAPNVQPQANVAGPSGTYHGGTVNPYAQQAFPSNPNAQAGVPNPHPQAVAGPSNTHQQQHHTMPTASGTNFEEFMDLDFDHNSFL